jgi:glc operon protein GlcG
MAHATQNFKKPVCVSVCDATGLLLAFVRMDGAPVRSVAIAQGKAYSAARMGVTTQAVLERLHRENIEIGYFCDPLLTALPGGSPLKDKGGVLRGAIGVSGLTSAEDQQVTDHVAGLFAA